MFTSVCCKLSRYIKKDRYRDEEFFYSFFLFFFFYMLRSRNEIIIHLPELSMYTSFVLDVSLFFFFYYFKKIKSYYENHATESAMLLDQLVKREKKIIHFFFFSIPMRITYAYTFYKYV